jgi:hypothetical protein
VTEEDRRPGEHQAADEISAGGDSLEATVAPAGDDAALRRRVDSPFRRWRLFDRNRRRREHTQLKLLVADSRPAPSTYGLGAVELCAEAARLRAAGWSVGEIRRVLLVPPDCEAAA